MRKGGRVGVFSFFLVCVCMYGGVGEELKEEE